MVSSRDVAKLAGVSQTTVSRVLNGSPLVRKNTIHKVEKAIKELQFRPNHIARSLVSNKTNTIALITEHLHNPFYVETTTSIVNIASEHGYNVIVHFHSFNDKASLYDVVLNQRVDGIIMSSIMLDDDIYDKLDQLSLPFITFNRKHRSGGNYVELDNLRASAMAVDYLVSLGHQKIAYVGGPHIASTFLNRLIGYQNAYQHHHLVYQDAFVKMTDTEPLTIRKACDELLQLQTNRPTAILAATDAIALTCLDYLLSVGIRVPEHISLLGIDDIQLASHQAIQLSTVGNCSEKNMGELAIHRLLDMLKSNETQPALKQISLEPLVIPRQTTSAPISLY